jgi:hypothetical protein
MMISGTCEWVSSVAGSAKSWLDIRSSSERRKVLLLVSFLFDLNETERRIWLIFQYSRFHFSNAEVICAAEQQLEAAGGIAESLFVTVKVTLDADGQPLVDAWQVKVFGTTSKDIYLINTYKLLYQICKQGLEMVAEGALQVSPHPGTSAVHPTFTAYVEMKKTKEVSL